MPSVSTNKTKAAASRRSASRHSTPGASIVAPAFDQASLEHTEYLETPISKLMVPENVSYAVILEELPVDKGVPDATKLRDLLQRLKELDELASQRGEACDRGMRDLGEKRKEVAEEEMERERVNMEKEERKEKHRRREAEEEDERSRNKKLKKRKDSSRSREERPLTHGAHGVARQDGVDVEMKDAPSSPQQRRGSKKGGASPRNVKREMASASLSSPSASSRLPSPGTVASAVPSRAASPGDSDSSESSRQPAPAAAVPRYQTFGPDPSTFDDPTIYHIREVNPGMSEEEIREIYSVADYPHDDLHDLIPGTPPDKDFSNGKPSANQVIQSTFAAAMEPYFRPLTEDDMAFLRERGDRVTPFVMPRRGKRHYTEVWAEEDGAMSIDSNSHRRDHLPANQPRGSIDQMTDDVAETEQVSAGPLLSRLISAMAVEDRAPQSEDKVMTNGISNGDTNGVNGSVNGDADENADGEKSGPLPPATFMPDSTQPGWRVPTTKLDYAQVDERLKQELRHLGFITEDAEPDYDAHYDDEIAARLRILQDRLKEQCIINGARKARIAEVMNDRMAHQEYNTIREDLDQQVTQAYLKRNRTLGKSKKQQKRPGGAGGGSHFVAGPAGGAAGTSRPGIGDAVKTVMERRKRWIDNVGPVFDDVPERVPREGESIFDDSNMSRLVQKERDNWDDGEE